MNLDVGVDLREQLSCGVVVNELIWRAGCCGAFKAALGATAIGCTIGASDGAISGVGMSVKLHEADRTGFLDGLCGVHKQ